MVDQETNLLNAFETTLTAQMGPTDLTATVASTSTLASPCYLVIEPESDTQREYILFDGAFTGTTFVTTTTANRYLAGSAAASGLTHPVGSVVRMVPLAQHIEDINDRVDADRVDFDSHHGGNAVADHPEATASARGFATAAQITKLDAITGTNTGDETAARVRALGFFDTTNDGAGSGLDADLLDGVEGSGYAAAAHGSHGAGADTTAIHDDTAGEIVAVTEKATLVAADEFLIEDSAAGNAKKSAKISAIRITESQVTDLDHTDVDAIHDNVAGEINAVTLKATLVGADIILVEDSAAANAKKRSTIAGIRITESQVTDLDHTDVDAFHDDVNSEISALTQKATPVAGDHLLIEDSAGGNVKRRILISSLPINDTKTTFVPTLQAEGTDPTLGSGSTADGLLIRSGRLCHVWTYFKFGSSGASSGSGNYYVDLSVEGLPSISADWPRGGTLGGIAGHWFAYGDGGNNKYTGGAILHPTNDWIMGWEGAGSGSKVAHNDPINPFDANDELGFYVTYATDDA